MRAPPADNNREQASPVRQTGSGVSPRAVKVRPSAWRTTRGMRPNPITANLD